MAPPPTGPASPPAPPEPSATASATEVTLTRDELAAASGLDERSLSGLVEFGIIDGAKDTYDGDDLVAAKAAAGLIRYGVEPRHLKMYRHFAERESAFFEQIVSPVSRRRDPQAQQEAARSIAEIMGLAQRFRDAMLRSTMRDLL